MKNVQVNIREVPKKWYNIIPDLPEKLPMPKDPESGESKIKQLPRILLKTALEQEFSDKRWVKIPEELSELYQKAGRPRPLFRATGLEKFLKTPAKIYYKSEFYSPTGSHKVNTALAQAYYAMKEGKERITTETGAGQWGSALSYAASLMGIKCTVYWVRAAYNIKPDRLSLMKLFGSRVFASPSSNTNTGRALLEKDKNHPGSLGIAVSEGIEDTLGSENSVYCLGSVLNHVLMHQTIIGLETKKQFELLDEYPDIMIGCLGGGSNFGGFVIPFISDKIKKKTDTRFIAAQTESSPSLVKGEYMYDYGDHAEFTPMMKMYTLGHKNPLLPPIKAEGLRYHAAAPILSLLRHHGIIEAVSYPSTEKEVFEAAKIFTQTEGFIPAPESAYGIKAAIEEAVKCRKTGEKKVIALNVSGHGFLDLGSYKEILNL